MNNLRWEITRGLQLALVYCLFAVIISAANPEAFSANEVTLAESSHSLSFHGSSCWSNRRIDDIAAR